MEETEKLSLDEKAEKIMKNVSTFIQTFYGDGYKNDRTKIEFDAVNSLFKSIGVVYIRNPYSEDSNLLPYLSRKELDTHLLQLSMLSQHLTSTVSKATSDESKIRAISTFRRKAAGLGILALYTDTSNQDKSLNLSKQSFVQRMQNAFCSIFLHPSRPDKKPATSDNTPSKRKLQQKSLQL